MPRRLHDTALVPRTRSSHHNCRESDCELRVQSGTSVMSLPVSSDSEVRIETCCKIGRTSESGHQRALLTLTSAGAKRLAVQKVPVVGGAMGRNPRAGARVCYIT